MSKEDLVIGHATPMQPYPDAYRPNIGINPNPESLGIDPLLIPALREKGTVKIDRSLIEETLELLEWYLVRTPSYSGKFNDVVARLQQALKEESK